MFYGCFVSVVFFFEISWTDFCGLFSGGRFSFLLGPGAQESPNEPNLEK